MNAGWASCAIGMLRCRFSLMRNSRMQRRSLRAWKAIAWEFIGGTLRRAPVAASRGGAFDGWSPARLGACFLMLVVFAGLEHIRAFAEEPWQVALANMPLTNHPAKLDRLNCTEVLMTSFALNDTVKAMIFMPGSTDELYLFRRVNVTLPAGPCSVLDAVNAVTNQSEIRALFRPPFLVFYTAEDNLEPVIKVEEPPIRERLERAHFPPHIILRDTDWIHLQPILQGSLHIRFAPSPHSTVAWHFFRTSMAAWNLTGWEALEAVSMAGRTQAILRHHWLIAVPEAEVAFEEDRRPPPQIRHNLTLPK